MGHDNVKSAKDCINVSVAKQAHNSSHWKRQTKKGEEEREIPTKQISHIL